MWEKEKKWVKRGKARAFPARASRGREGPARGNALRERDSLSSHGLDPQYFRRWQA